MNLDLHVCVHMFKVCMGVCIHINTDLFINYILQYFSAIDVSLFW